jgi:serine/threonine-protein kinase
MSDSTLQTGRTVLHYRVADKIGEGGMGEVWRATDTELGRDVAIKVLPAALADDAERLARFEREARLLASLNHAHIATIHGLHEAEIEDHKVRFLVMELVEGEDLLDFVARGVSFDRAIEIAIQIARALEAAHGSGIVHRDLKPANVKMTASREIKVLDFGLAKAVGVEPESGGTSLPTMSPTITSAGTVAGAIMGTAAYMSPEQARGRKVDRRADMWAFGCLLYELLTGKRAFGGDTISDTLAAVLKETPDWSALPDGTPVGVRRLLRRCLEKDPRKRWNDAADARLELEEALSETPEEAAAPAAPGEAVASSPVRRLVPWLVAAAAIVVAVAAWVRGGSGPATSNELLRLSIPLDLGLRIEDDQAGNVTLSPDGKRLAFSGIDEAGQSALYLRSLNTSEIVRLEGTANAENPVFSPDGAWIAFFSEGRIKKVPVAGGPPLDVCEGVGSARGAVWGPDGRIIFPRHFDTGLWQVPGSGGTPTELTELDDARRERTHRWPSVVPGRPIVLFTVATKDSPEYYDDALIDAVHLETGERKTVLEGASFARYAPSGHLIFGRQGSLWAVPFDVDSLSASGAPTPVLSKVMGVRNSGVVFASLAANGILAYVEGQPEDLQREIRWRYFDGRSEVVSEIPVGSTITLELSPDGKKIATATAGAATYDIWVHDLESGSRTRLTFEGDNSDPHWSPDGKQIYYSSVRDGLGMVFRKPADGTGDEELVWRVDGVSVGSEDISSDGRTLLMSYHGENKADLYTLALDDPAAEPQPLLQGPFEEDLARFSPDGAFLAYTTDEPGNYEVLVRPASGSGGQWQISTGGGLQPRWSPDGKRLFYRVGRRLYAVDVETGNGGAAFRASNPKLVLDDLERARLTGAFDVSLAGDAILVPSSLQDEAPLDEITVLVNWLDEVERLVPSAD